MNPARFMLFFKFSFLTAGLLFTWIAHVIPARPGPPIEPNIEAILLTMAFADIVLAFVFPPYLARAAARKASTAPTLPPLQQWMSFNLVALTFLESCVLFGFVLHVLGANARLAFTVMGIGILAILLWRPSAPPAVQPPSAPQNRM